MLGHKDCVAAVVEEFPELKEAVEGNPELLHVQMGEFAALTQRAINANDFPVLRRCFAVADRGYADPAPELENAFNVSFLEDLDFRGSPKANKLMSSRLRRGWVEINEYLDQLLTRKPHWRP